LGDVRVSSVNLAINFVVTEFELDVTVELQQLMPEINPYEAPQTDPPEKRIAGFWEFVGKNLWLAFELQALGLVLVLIGAQATIINDSIVSAHQVLLYIYAVLGCLALLVVVYALWKKAYGLIGIELVFVLVGGLGFLEWLPRIHWE
jgi:hypothetical protein